MEYYNYFIYTLTISYIYEQSHGIVYENIAHQKWSTPEQDSE